MRIFPKTNRRKHCLTFSLETYSTENDTNVRLLLNLSRGDPELQTLQWNSWELPHGFLVEKAADTHLLDI